MKDRLEEFVRSNQEAFDIHEPNPSLWLKISAQNEAGNVRERGKGRVRALHILRYAAAVAVIFAGFSAGIYYLSGAKSDPRKLYGTMYLEVLEAEAYYSGIVTERYDELEPYFSGAPGLKETIDADLDELDHIYGELKEDLKDNVANPEVIEAMIRNYRMKAEILEDLLSQIREKERQDYDNKTQL